MKKIYFLLLSLAFAGTSFAQAIENPGFETWRSSTAGAETIYAPTSWYGLDSTIIDLGAGFSLVMHPQIFQSTAIKNSGSSSAMILSVEQDMLGFFPGMLSNAVPAVDVSVIIAGGDPMSAISFSGGTATNLRITTVSAYVNYTAGKDSLGVTGNDTANMGVQAISIIGGVETTVGTGSVTILPTSSSFTQVTSNVTYTDTSHAVSLVRFFFTSGGMATLDSSTLYVDDITMTGVEQHPIAVHNVAAKSDLVKVYPNPASGIIHLDGPQNAGLTCQLVSVSGQVAATQTLNGSDMMDVSLLPAGLYFYIISDVSGNKVQRGTVTVNN